MPDFAWGSAKYSDWGRRRLRSTCTAMTQLLHVRDVSSGSVCAVGARQPAAMVLVADQRTASTRHYGKNATELQEPAKRLPEGGLEECLHTLTPCRGGLVGEVLGSSA